MDVEHLVGLLDGSTYSRASQILYDVMDSLVSLALYLDSNWILLFLFCPSSTGSLRDSIE